MITRYMRVIDCESILNLYLGISYLVDFQVFRDSVPNHYLKIIDTVWNDKDNFLKWPKQPLLFKEGSTRSTACHRYSNREKQTLKFLRIAPDTRNNGPAIMSFLVAGGIRPYREDGKGWTIHHIYDGRFVYPNKNHTTHAVKHPMYFSEAAGLVAAHPIADSLADEFGYFAWLLRHEAFLRFSFDPDSVFQKTEA